MARRGRDFTAEQAEVAQRRPRRDADEGLGAVLPGVFRAGGSQGQLRGSEGLEGLLPVCATCHHIRDEAGAWQRIDSYLNVQTGVQVSHGLCPSCAKIHYGMTDEQIAQAEAEQRGAE